MAETTVAAEVHEVLDVTLNLAAELAHHFVVLLNVVTNLADFTVVRSRTRRLGQTRGSNNVT